MTSNPHSPNAHTQPEVKDVVAATYTLSGAGRNPLQSGTSYYAAVLARVVGCPSRSGVATTFGLQAPYAERVTLAYTGPSARVFNTKDFTVRSLQKSASTFECVRVRRWVIGLQHASSRRL